MGSLTTSQPKGKPAAKKCIVNSCLVFVEPKKFGTHYFAFRYCEAHGAEMMAAHILEETKAKALAATERLGLPLRFKGSSFNNFRTEYQPTAFTVSRRWADEYKPGVTKKGLYLFGIPGTGKTHLAAAIANQLKLEEYVRFITSPELLMKIRHTFGKEDDGLLDRLGNTRLLILDDLGSEKPSEWVQETLFVLIDRRYTMYLPTIITSNCSLDQLKDRLGYRIASRIAEMCEVVELRADDFRIKKTN